MVIVAVAAIDAMYRHPWLRPLTAWWPAVHTGAAVGLPLSALVDPDTYDRPERADAAERVVARIPTATASTPTSA